MLSAAPDIQHVSHCESDARYTKAPNGFHVEKNRRTGDCVYCAAKDTRHKIDKIIKISKVLMSHGLQPSLANIEIELYYAGEYDDYRDLLSLLSGIKV
jgi:hypothetical protein